MQNSKNKSATHLIAGILFTICVLIRLVWMFQWKFSIGGVLYVAGCALLAFSLVTKRRDFLSAVGFGLLAVCALLEFGDYASYGYPALLVNIWRFADLLELVGYLGMAFLALVCATEILPQYREKCKKLWFSPAILVTIAEVLSVLNRLSLGSRLTFTSFLLKVLLVIAYFMASAWLAYPDGLPGKQVNASDGSTQTVAGEAYCSLVKHILLLLFTFGIWLLIWIYRITGYTNNVEGEEDRKPTNKLLLCMFVPFYQIYWTYKTAQRIDKMAKGKGISSELSTLCLILAIFVPIIPPILMQDKMNAIATVADAPVRQQAANSDKPDLGVAEELKTYKDLLDSGVITQEEFDAKKKQLLGL